MLLSTWLNLHGLQWTFGNTNVEVVTYTYSLLKATDFDASKEILWGNKKFMKLYFSNDFTLSTNKDLWISKYLPTRFLQIHLKTNLMNVLLLQLLANCGRCINSCRTRAPVTKDMWCINLKKKKSIHCRRNINQQHS